MWCGFTLVMLHGTYKMAFCVSDCSLTVSPSDIRTPPPKEVPCRNNAVITDFRAHENNGRYVIGYLDITSIIPQCWSGFHFQGRTLQGQGTPSPYGRASPKATDCLDHLTAGRTTMVLLYLPMTAALDLPGSRVRPSPIHHSSRLTLHK